MRITYPIEDCGLFWYEGRTRHVVPLEGVHVAVRIVDTIAEVQVVQFYANTWGHTIDTSYTFPLDESAAVCGFEAELPDKLLIGEVREKQQARQEYQAALARGETAALLEQNKANVFTQKIGNIPAHSRVNIRITYCADLKVESDGAIRLVLPTSLSPRYYSPYAAAPEYFLVPWAHSWSRYALGRRINYGAYSCCHPGWYDELPYWRWNYWVPETVISQQNPCAFSVTVEVEMPSKVTHVVSPTHTIRWDPNPESPNLSTVSFWSQVEPMDKDFVLNIYQEKPNEPHVELEVAPNGSGCAMITMVPEFDLDPEPTEIIFLVDVSGSMRGDRIKAAIRALKLFLRVLPISCAFNVYSFSSSFKALFPSGPQKYSKDTLSKATTFVSGLRAFGGTELYPPLNDIFRRPIAAGRARQIFCLTDGQVDNTEIVIDLCRRNAKNSRLFTVGIGEEVDRLLVEGMARAGTGTAEFIQGADLNSEVSGALEAKLVNQLRTATLPSLTKVLVDWGQLGPLSPPEGSPVVTETQVTFRVKHPQEVPAGESLLIVGSIPELGSWNPNSALKLSTNPHAAPFWAALATISSAQKFSFKLIRTEKQGFLYEQTEGNREVTISGTECTIECGEFGVQSTPQVTQIVTSSSAPQSSQSTTSSSSSAPPPPPPTAQGIERNIYQAPFLPPPIFSGNKFVMYALFSPGSLPINSIRLSAEAPGGELVIDLPITKLNTVGKTLHVLAARALIRDLEESTSHLHWAQTGAPPTFRSDDGTPLWFRGSYIVTGAKQDRGSAWNLSPVSPDPRAVRQEMIDLGLKFGITSRETSFVAVERWLDGRRGDSATPLLLPSESVIEAEEEVEVERSQKGSAAFSFSSLSSSSSSSSSSRQRQSSIGKAVAGGRGGSIQRAAAPQKEMMKKKSDRAASPPSLPPPGAPPPPSKSAPPSAPSVQAFSALRNAAPPPPFSPVVPVSSPTLSSAMPCAESFSMISSPASDLLLEADHFDQEECDDGDFEESIQLEEVVKLRKSEESRSRCEESRSSRKKKLSKPKAFLKVSSATTSSSSSSSSAPSRPSAPSLSFSPTSAPAPSIPSSPQPKAFDRALLMEQDFDGSFECNGRVASFLGLTESQLKSQASAKKSALGSSSDADAALLWTSIVVIAYLAKHWSSSQATWQMSSEKTRSWCLQQLQANLGIDRTAARRLLESLISEI